MSVGRPGGITLIMVLTVVSGLLNVLAGVLLLAERSNRVIESELRSSSDSLLVMGILAVAIGIVQLAVARGLGRGGNGSRQLVMVIATLSFVVSVWTAAQNNGQPRITAVLSAAMALIAILILNSRGSRSFFGA